MPDFELIINMLDDDWTEEEKAKLLADMFKEFRSMQYQKYSNEEIARWFKGRIHELGPKVIGRKQCTKSGNLFNAMKNEVLRHGTLDTQCCSK